MTSSNQAIFDLMDNITGSTTVAGAWNAYFDLARSAGMKAGIACFLPGAEKLSDITFADAMPAGWVREYSETDAISSDSLARQLRRCHSPFEWSLAGYPRPAGGSHWHDFTQAHGMVTGYVVPDYSHGDLCVISLVANPKPLDRYMRMVLYFTGLAFLARCRELGVRHGAEIPELSERERECLLWASAGKSDWQIGEILGLSDKTVNSYMERAKQKLSAHTRVQAIVRAMRQGIIDV